MDSYGERESLEANLARWARDRQQLDEERDTLILTAIASGVSKHRVHVLTGIARTTIDRISEPGRLP